MGFARDKFKDFAIAFWKTAKQDLVRAEDAYKEGAYSYAVFHAQQSAEKAVKGIMEMEEVFVRDHDWRPSDQKVYISDFSSACFTPD